VALALQQGPILGDRGRAEAVLKNGRATEYHRIFQYTSWAEFWVKPSRSYSSEFHISGDSYLVYGLDRIAVEAVTT